MSPSGLWLRSIPCWVTTTTCHATVTVATATTPAACTRPLVVSLRHRLSHSCRSGYVHCGSRLTAERILIRQTPHLVALIMRAKGERAGHVTFPQATHISRPLMLSHSSHHARPPLVTSELSVTLCVGVLWVSWVGSASVAGHGTSLPHVNKQLSRLPRRPVHRWRHDRGETKEQLRHRCKGVVSKISLVLLNVSCSCYD